MVQNTDLTFFTNEPERDLYSRFSKILKSNTQSLPEKVIKKCLYLLKYLI